MKFAIGFHNALVAGFVLATGTSPARTAVAQGHPPAAAPAHAAPGAPAPAPAPAPEVAAAFTGTVVETMPSGGYTYVLVESGGKKTWAAAPQFNVAVGDRVAVPEGMPMRNFRSKTLNRDFDVVYFVPSVRVEGARPAAPHAMDPAAAAPHAMDPAAAHAGHGGGGASKVDLSNIAKASGGYTVAELYASKASLAGKDVAVRGRVVKFTGGVMNKNWMHVRDGSGEEGRNDLTVSTDAKAAVGDLVVVSGKLGVDRDLGAGYRYDIIVEDAKVTAE